MSAPVRQPRDIDPALMYAPPHAREQGRDVDEDLETGSQPATDWSEPHDLDAEPEFSGDRAILGVQRRLALDPEWIPEPPMTGDRDVRMAGLQIGGLLCFAAIVAWVVMSTPTMKLLLSGAVIGASFPESGAGAPAELPVAHRGSKMQVADIHRSHDDLTAPLSQPEIVRPPSPQAHLDATAEGAIPLSTVTLSSVTPTAAAASVARDAHSSADAANFISRHIDRNELDGMLERADGLIKSGDLSSARLLLRRAAEAGDVRAAFALAGTFDPKVLKIVGVRDGAPDLVQARLWYERAAQLGSADAARRLQQLASVSVQ